MLLLLPVALAEDVPLEDRALPVNSRLLEAPLELGHVPPRILSETPLEDMLDVTDITQRTEPVTVIAPPAAAPVEPPAPPPAPSLDPERLWLLQKGLRAEDTYQAGYANGTAQAKRHPDQQARGRGVVFGALLPVVGISLAERSVKENPPRLPGGRWSEGSPAYEEGCRQGYAEASLPSRREDARRSATRASVVVGALYLLVLL